MEVTLQDTSFTKVCPRCGERLFRDMSICYGCLYDFNHPQPIERPPRTLVQEAKPEPEEEDVRPLPEEEERDQVPEREDRGSSSGMEGTDAMEEDDKDTTLDLTGAAAAVQAEGSYGIWIKDEGIDVHMPVGEEGLTVGRAPSNDIVLHIRAVSRHHLRLSSAAGGVAVEDLGATNPALVDGKALQGSCIVAPGDGFEVCGVSFEVERLDACTG